jgi:putative phosphoesterase
VARSTRKRRASSTAIVGVIADTHGLLRPEAVMALRGADVIVHAGDIGSAALLAELGAIAPVVAVRGNNDRGPWAASLPETVTTSIAGVRLHVVHDLKTLTDDPAVLGVDVVISGHSHKPVVERRGRLLLLNPGSAGPRRFSLPIALARLRLGPAGARVRIVELDVAPRPTRRPAARGAAALTAPRHAAQYRPRGRGR